MWERERNVRVDRLRGEREQRPLLSDEGSAITRRHVCDRWRNGTEQGCELHELL